MKAIGLLMPVAFKKQSLKYMLDFKSFAEDGTSVINNSWFSGTRIDIHLHMAKMIKLIWDFRGPDASKIAEHHSKHLLEYAFTQELQNNMISSEDLTDMHSIASIVISEDIMRKVRDELKPHRGEYVQQESD